MEEMYAALCMCAWQKRLSHSGVGGGIALREVYPARAYTTVVVLVQSSLAAQQLKTPAP